MTNVIDDLMEAIANKDEEIERLSNLLKQTDMYEWMELVDKLKEENARLREALQEVSKILNVSNSKRVAVPYGIIDKIINKALKANVKNNEQ